MEYIFVRQNDAPEDAKEENSNLFTVGHELQERRGERRSNVDLRLINIWTPSPFAKDPKDHFIVKNLSTNGAYLLCNRTDILPDEGQIQIQFLLPNCYKPLVLRAKIVRRQQHVPSQDKLWATSNPSQHLLGAGLIFTAAREKDFQALQKFLQDLKIHPVGRQSIEAFPQTQPTSQSVEPTDEEIEELFDRIILTV